MLHISPATVGREWTLAKAWLYAEPRTGVCERGSMVPRGAFSRRDRAGPRNQARNRGMR